MLRRNKTTSLTTTSIDPQKGKENVAAKFDKNDSSAFPRRGALLDKGNRPPLVGQKKGSIMGTGKVGSSISFVKKADSLHVPNEMLQFPFRKPVTRADTKPKNSQSNTTVVRVQSFVDDKSKKKPEICADLDRLIRPTINSLRRQQVVDKNRRSIQLKTPQLTKANADELKSEMSAISSDGTLNSETSYSSAMIPDIDAEDGANPLQGCEYVIDIYNYLFWLERRQPIREDYLRGRVVTPRMRSILTDWMVLVHLRFHLLPETLHMTVLLLDRFLQNAVMTKEQLQLVGVTCMFVASKYEEMFAPEVSDFVYMTDNTYSKEEILTMEIKILDTLNFEIGRPHSIHFLRRFSKALGADANTHTLAKYICEASFTDYALVHIVPSELAAAALRLATLIKGSGKWDAKMAHYSQYGEEDLALTIQRMAKQLHRTHTTPNKLQAVQEKYASSKLLAVSKLSDQQIKLLKDLSVRS